MERTFTYPATKTEFRIKAKKIAYAFLLCLNPLNSLGRFS
jgi:hypothetical protein